MQRYVKYCWISCSVMRFLNSIGQFKKKLKVCWTKTLMAHNYLVAHSDNKRRQVARNVQFMFLSARATYTEQVRKL